MNSKMTTRRAANRVGRFCEPLETRRLLSEILSAPGKPHVMEISAVGANDVVWAPASDNDGGGISYTLWYKQLGSHVAVPAGTTSGDSLPLCNGYPTDPISPRTGYLVWVVSKDNNSGVSRASVGSRFRTDDPLTPAMVRKAYGFNQIYKEGYQGQGEVIGLAELGSDPTLAADITNFDRMFHLAPPDLEVVNESGGSSPMPPDTGHGHEIALDVEWAHAIAPDAKIVVVEGNDSTTDTTTSIQGLLAAAQEAASLGASVVSMSYGYDESAFDASGVGTVQQLDSDFQKSGVTFVAAAGDFFGQPGWPSVSADVLSVGGTQMSLGSSGNFNNEIVWQNVDLSDSTKGSGSGYGQFSSQDDPSGRQTPDVSYAADGYSWYFDGALNTEGFGTSFGSPQWAALLALVDEGRQRKGLENLDSNTGGDTSLEIHDALASAAATDFRDNSASFGEPASQGSNIQTGLGTPTANLMNYLITYQ